MSLAWRSRAWAENLPLEILPIYVWMLLNCDLYIFFAYLLETIFALHFSFEIIRVLCVCEYVDYSVKWCKELLI